MEMDRLNSHFPCPSPTAPDASLVAAIVLWFSNYGLALADLVYSLVHIVIIQGQYNRPKATPQPHHNLSTIYHKCERHFHYCLLFTVYSPSIESFSPSLTVA
jgi:hypothetical protein